MAIEKLFQENFEFFTLETNPSRIFSSSSSGITGGISLFPRASSIEKEVQPLSSFSASYYIDENLDDVRRVAVSNTSTDILSDITAYLNGVNSQQVSARKLKKIEIIRFTPSFGFSSNTIRKTIVRKSLMPFYRTTCPRSQFNYSNYHCMNFFTGSNLPDDSVLLYPNVATAVIDNITGSQYQVSGAFTFDFWMKPTYTTDAEGAEYKPGTLMHLSSAYAITLHTGSSVSLQGLPNKFRVAIALSGAADILPSEQTAGPLTFFSADNSLEQNSWNHVTIRWGGVDHNFGSGSILINGLENSTFTITESLAAGMLGAGGTDPSVLAIGNYYEGQNVGISALDRFFGADTAIREGLVEVNPSSGFNSPDLFSFTHPLNAEVHEIKLYNKYLTTTEISALQINGPTNLDNLQFYLPPFFTEVSPYRKFLNTHGGVMVTPFFERDGSTNDPFAVRMAFGAGGHYINLENYVRDFASDNYPRLLALSGSTFTPGSSTELSANNFLYATGSVQKRLYTILPCNNGEQFPNFDLLSAFTGSTKFIDELGNKELGVINLNSLLDENDFPSKAVTTSGSILNDILGARPEAISDVPGDSLAILHRTRDGSSNQVVFFDVSNMFYGNKIKPGTVCLIDKAISGSSNKISITIKDDGLGNLYRAGTDGPHPSWASVGNVFYNEGIILIKHPQLFFIGESQYEISFKGEQDIHVLTINAFAKSLSQVTSSNPSFDPSVSLSDINDNLANEPDQKYVYVTGIQIHDENLNVIMRTNIAQPLLKKSSDKFLFKVKLDF